MGGGGDVPEQEESPQERAQAQAAIESWNERFEDGFADLEKQAVAEADFDHNAFIAGRGAGDLAKAEKEAYDANTADGVSFSELSRTGNVVADGVTSNHVKSASAAQNMQTDSLLRTAKTGRDVAAGASNGLRNAATLGAETARSKLQDEIMVSNAEAQAKMTALQGAIKGAGMRSQGYRLTGKGIQRTHEEGMFGAKELTGDAKAVADEEKMGWGKTALAFASDL